MSWALILGGSVLTASPFILVTAMMIHDLGWLETLILWGIVFGICATIIVGSILILTGMQA